MQIFSNLFNKKKDIPKKIISFDGGGVRVIAGIVFLKKLEVESGKKIKDMFDMFVGTSAGAFNASCLAFDDMSMIDLKSYWSKEYLDRLMETSFFWDQASLVQARPRYETKGRLKFLKEIFGEKTLGESKKPLVTLCYDIEKRTHVIHSSNLTPDISFVDAVCASSAAPIYFPTASMEDGRWLIDGGIATNNPSLLGYIEAKKIFSTNNIKVLGIGAGLNKRKISGRNSRNWGALGWFRHDILGIMLESSLQNEILKDLIGDDYLRVNSPIGNVNRRMDDMSEKNLHRIKELADDWWLKFGKKSINFINS